MVEEMAIMHCFGVLGDVLQKTEDLGDDIARNTEGSDVHWH